MAKRRRDIEISEKLRMQTLIPILEGKELEEIAPTLFIATKSLKYRLTQMYRFYGVKNRIQLMALFVKVPDEFRGALEGSKPKVSTGFELPTGNKL